MTHSVHIPLPPCSHCPSHREDAPFPFIVKHRLVLFLYDRAHAVHTAHVMYAIHAALPAFDTETFATPTIASRVTSSAVLSHTRTSTSSGSSSPNSRSTPRGSMTARERYGADLYHTGGSPSTGHG